MDKLTFDQRLPDFSLTVKNEATWRVDPDDCDWLVRLAWERGGPCLVGREIPFVDRKPKRYKFRVTTDWAFAIMDRVRRIRVPAIPYFAIEIGCDGGFTELWTGGYDGKAHYRWWSCPPSSNS